jgi:succinate dehydrogenase / fumarate reductase cytochrome b subunit
MGVLGELWRSTVGRKALVSVTGLVLWGWVALHVLGNLTMWSGAAATDRYAAALREVPGALWAVRAVLAAAALLHIAGVASLARASRRARPGHRVTPSGGVGRLASRAIRIGGVALLAFIGYHILHLTFGLWHPGFTPGHVYENVVAGLRPAWVAAVYVAGAVLVGLHLLHGLWAASRSLGVRPGAATRSGRPVVALLAAATVMGFASVPIAVLAGWLR